MAPALRPCSGSPQIAPLSTTLLPPCASPSSPSLRSSPPPPLLHSSSTSQLFPPLALSVRISNVSVTNSGSVDAGSSSAAPCPIISGGETSLVESRVDSLSKSNSTLISPSLVEVVIPKPSNLPGVPGAVIGGGPGGSSCSSGGVDAPAVGTSSASLGSSVSPSWASVVNKSNLVSGTPHKFFPPPSYSGSVLEIFPPVEVIQHGDAV